MLSIIHDAYTIKNYMLKTGKVFNLSEFYETSKTQVLENETVLNPPEQLKRNLRHLTDFSVTQKPAKKRTKFINPLANERSGLL